MGRICTLIMWVQRYSVWQGELLFLTGQNEYWKHIWLQKHSGRRYSSAVFLHIISFVKDSEMFYHSDRFSAVISSVRLEQRVFFKMLRTWNFTVFSEINSFSDISPLESPSIIRLRTSFSRKESSYFWINAFSVLPELVMPGGQAYKACCKAGRKQ